MEPADFKQEQRVDVGRGGSSCEGSFVGAGLAGALGLGDRELVAFVGGGGKTSALQNLAGELSERGPVITTTTTNMFLQQLAATGPMSMNEDADALVFALRRTLLSERVAAAALRAGTNGKAVGLPVEWVDRLWTKCLASYILVEADGSKGLSLKAFGTCEPQVPNEATVIVLLAGVDVIGSSLTDLYVHRAEIAAAALGVPLGSVVSPDIFVACLHLQIALLRESWPACRVVVLLNKVEGPEREGTAKLLAERLLTGSGCSSVAEGRRDKSACPDAVIAGSIREHRFRRVRPALTISAVVLAAGCATRMGTQKVLLPLKGRPLVDWVVDAALNSQTSQTIVVTGHEGAAVSEAMSDRPVEVVVNPRHAEGMSTSLQAGLRAVRPGCEAVVVLLGDQPFVTSALIDQLVDRFMDSDAWVVRPSIAGHPAHPVVMSARLFPEILEQHGDVGGREIALRHPGKVCLIPVDDLRLDLDVDTSEDYEAALALAEERETERP